MHFVLDGFDVQRRHIAPVRLFDTERDIAERLLFQMFLDFSRSPSQRYNSQRSSGDRFSVAVLTSVTVLIAEQ